MYYMHKLTVVIVYVVLILNKQSIVNHTNTFKCELVEEIF